MPAPGGKLRRRAEANRDGLVLSIADEGGQIGDGNLAKPPSQWFVLMLHRMPPRRTQNARPELEGPGPMPVTPVP